MPGGLITERMIGWSVTTLTKIEITQKLAKTATFWMSGMGAIATTRIAKPSARIDAIAGGKRWEYDSTMAACLSPSRCYSSWYRSIDWTEWESARAVRKIGITRTSGSRLRPSSGPKASAQMPDRRPENIGTQMPVQVR